MKLRTHIVFSFVVGYGLLRLLGAGIRCGVVVSVATSVAVNLIVDAGHAVRGRLRVRSYLTHSPAGIWVPLLVSLLPYVLARWTGLGVSVGPALLLAAGFASFASHLALDMLTESGVYLTPRKRVALAHFRYDGLADTVFFAVSVILAALIMGADVLGNVRGVITWLWGVVGG